MGNSLSNEEKLERTIYINKMLEFNFPKLDLRDRYSYTGYIDFIKPIELKSNNVMMGKDGYYNNDGEYILSRPFFIFKAELQYPNGIKKKMFTTFFQRYSDDKILWHCCGHYGPILMYTDGGASNEQIKMLYELIKFGEYKLSKDDVYKLKLNYELKNSYDHKDEIDESKLPTNIILGYSDNTIEDLHS